MEYPFNSETIEHMGVTVRIEYFTDFDQGFPFEDDGMGQCANPITGMALTGQPMATRNLVNVR